MQGIYIPGKFLPHKGAVKTFTELEIHVYHQDTGSYM